MLEVMALNVLQAHPCFSQSVLHEDILLVVLMDRLQSLLEVVVEVVGTVTVAAEDLVVNTVVMVEVFEVDTEVVIEEGVDLGVEEIIKIDLTS